jgi:DNA invertase Pin-like site-specific DNA recombinase
LQEPIGTSGVSTVFRQRPEGRKLWYQLTKGDTLIVSKIDRLGRKTRDIS